MLRSINAVGHWQQLNWSVEPDLMLISGVKCNLPLFVTVPLRSREEGKAVLWPTFHTLGFCQLQAGPIELQWAETLKKTQWTSNRVLGPPLWTALAMEVTNHRMYRGRRLRVLVWGYIYLYVCLFVFSVYRYKPSGWWVHANMHICEPVWACGTLAPSTLQKKAFSFFFFFFFLFLSLLNLPTSLLWSSPWQSCLPVALNSPGSYNTQ